MGATAVLLSVALDAGIGLGPPEMICGFPALQANEPPIRMDIARVDSLYGGPGRAPVHLQLSTGASDMRMAAIAQPLGPSSAPFVVIAGSPLTDIHFQLGLKGDGSAELTIRDDRYGDPAEVTRIGQCTDHENFFLSFESI